MLIGLTSTDVGLGAFSRFHAFDHYPVLRIDVLCMV